MPQTSKTMVMVGEAFQGVKNTEEIGMLEMLLSCRL